MAHVLVVEDEIPVLILAESVVKNIGHTTYSAASKKEALTLIETSDEIDAIFTDIRLLDNELGGCELAQEAFQKNPKLKVLYTSGQTPTDGIKAMFVPGSAFLPKPYTLHDLEVALNMVIDGFSDTH
jgi:two-component system, cell cycle sensor histidine kinase and response regulator CckA